MKLCKLFIVALCCYASASAQQQDEKIIKSISDEILMNGTAYDNLRYLCKKIGPRLSGSANAANAIAATVKMLKQAGADTVYLQPCMVTHWERGSKEVAFAYLPGNQKRHLNICALGNTVATALAGVKAQVVEVKSMEALHELGIAGLKNKIVFINIPMDPRYIETFIAYSESGIGRRSGPAQAAKYGAKAVIVRSLASNIDQFPHTGATQYNDSFPKIAAVAVSTADAEWLSAQLVKYPATEIFLKTNCKLFADKPSFNVIGEMWGTEMPEQIVSVGGHLDSWDLAEGAQDDGAGCVQSIEIIRCFKKLNLRPKRTIRAVLFMNEENGSKGGIAYAHHAEITKEQHIFALESDAGGFTPRGFSLQMNESQVAKVKSWAPLFYKYGVYHFVEGHAGSDVGHLRKLGTALAGLMPDSQRYFDLHHAANDVFEAVSKRELLLGAINMAAMVWLVSEYGL
ncbi:MAG: M20/M25/M40 family metallo-hydrolase [Niastella sp.]|nr:M20/M25/M40 family metallo-hydrolase [Niastella sp.]